MKSYAEWFAPLKTLTEDLSRIAPESETEFLSLGARLQEYVARAETMTDLAATIVEHTGGGDETAIEQADSVFRNIQTEIENCCAVFSQGISTVKDVAAKLEGLSGFLGALEKIAKHTRIMGVSIKIESARVGQEGKGFWDLAREVTDLAVRIHENVAFFRERLKSSGTVICGSTAEMEKNKADYELRFQSIWNHVTGLLEELSRSFKDSSEVSMRISGRSEEIHAKVGQVVMAMQFHDITRQQLEHVVEAVEEICTYLENQGDDGISGATGDNDWIVPAVSLQISHLREISKEVKNAGEGILDGMREVKRLSSEQMKDALGLASGKDLETGDTIFDRLETEINSIAAVLSEAGEFSNAMAKGMEAVSGSVEGMVRSINDIRDVGSRIKLSALNALAEATRTGDSGRALRVLAKELHLFSEGTGATTDGVIAALNDLSETTTVQKEYLLRIMDKQEDVKRLMEKTVSFSRDLGKEAAVVMDAARRLDELCVSMSESIDNVVRSAVFPEKMTRSIDAGADALERLFEKAGISQDKISGMASDHEMFKKFASRYSMEREREIHDKVSGAAMPEGVRDAASRSGNGSDIGQDNPDGDMAESLNAGNTLLFDDEQDERTMPTAEAEGDNELGDNIELF